MLYVSRIVGRNKWAVMDTDDYTETIVDHKGLYEAVITNGLKIEGVTVNRGLFTDRVSKMQVERTYIDDVTVYQNPAYVKIKNAKTAVLYGVDITMSGDTIVGISVKDKLLTKKVRLRLSDYGVACSGHILSELEIKTSSVLVLVMDDKVKIRRNTFVGITSMCGSVYIDVTEVKNKAQLQNVYFCDGFRGGPDIYELYIIDSEERLDFYKAVSILNNGPGIHSANTRILDSFRSPEITCQYLIENFKDEFIALVDSEISLKGLPSDGSWIDIFVNSSNVVAFRHLYNANKLDYGACLNVSNKVIWILRTVSTLNSRALNRFENYVRYFEPTTELRQAWMRLCINTVNWFTEYGRQKGWAE